MSIYAAIAASVFPALPQFAVGGPSFTGQRTSGGTPVADATVTSLNATTIYFIPAKLEDFKLTFPDVPVFTAPWYGFALAGTDIQAQDVYTDGALTYLITGEPATQYGFVLAPAAEQAQLPRSVALRAGAGYRAGLRIGAF
jgi:hypothetical protein